MAQNIPKLKKVQRRPNKHVIVELDVPGQVVQDPKPPPPKNQVAGYTPTEIIRAPGKVPHPDKEHDDTLVEVVRSPGKMGTVLIFIGLGIVAISIWGLIFLPAFGLINTLIVGLVGLILAFGGMVSRLAEK